MKKAILVGNGFTSQLIEKYKNSYMLDYLKTNSPDLFDKINYYFSSFRKQVDTFEMEQQGFGVCGDMNCGVTPLNRPTVGIVYNQELRNHIISELKIKGFQNPEIIYSDYFIKYGLIYDTQCNYITNIESALKIVELFKKIRVFKDDDYSEIKALASKLYYNDGKCEIKNIDRGNKEKIEEYFRSFDKIFTTNYDLLLDSSVLDYNNVRHLHGGYNYKNRYERSNIKLNASKAYLVWGINSEEKINELQGDLDFSSYKSGMSLFDIYLRELSELDLYELHIFGYSGENDGHINNAIKKSGVKDMYFYTDPNKISNSIQQYKVNEMFVENGNVKLCSWEEVWCKLL